VIKITENKVKLSELIVHGMLEKKASDVVVMDLRNIKGSVADYFILCSANSVNQADAIAESIEKEVYEATEAFPWHTEGKQNKEWILLDYVDIVAHIFQKEKRDFYGLEELWGDAKITNIETE
jgi:ribosome-associated protein